MTQDAFVLLFSFILGITIYPFLVYPILLTVLAKLRPKPPIRQFIHPRISILIAAHNEEKGLREKIENTLRLDYPSERREIIVVSDGSTDRTDAIAEEYKGAVKLVRTKGRVGKQIALNQGVHAAQGEVFVFTDVGLMLPSDALEKLVRNFADPAVGAVNGSVSVARSDESGMDNGESRYLAWDARVRLLEGIVDSTTGCCGLIYAVRRSCQVPFDASVANDMVAALDVAHLGYRSVVDEEVIGYSRSPVCYRREYRRKIRTIVGGMDAMWKSKVWRWGWNRPLFLWLLISHKVFRWLSPIGIVMLVGLVIAGALTAVPYTRYMAFLVCVALGLGILGFVLPKNWVITSPLRYFPFLLVGCTAGVVAWIEFLSGRKYVVWEPTNRDPIPMASSAPSDKSARKAHRL